MFVDVMGSHPYLLEGYFTDYATARLGRFLAGCQPARIARWFLGYQVQVVQHWLQVSIDSVIISGPDLTYI